MMRAVDFRLPDQEGKERSLSQFEGQWLVLYFYPKDDTPGCTKEACGFRDNFALFQERGVQVVGVSADSVESHRQFAEKYGLGFPLLSDESTETIKAYGAWGKKVRDGREFEGILRKTYLIDPSGEVRKVYEQVDPATHPGEILRDLETMR